MGKVQKNSGKKTAHGKEEKKPCAANMPPKGSSMFSRRRYGVFDHLPEKGSKKVHLE
jgi:hypothetical protein